MAGIFVEIVGNASQFKRELDSAVASTAKANTGFRRMGRAAGVAGLAIGGALVVGLVHAAKGALEDQVANDRLAQSFKNAHQPIGKFKDQIDAATKAGIKLGFHDEQVAETLGSLVTATHSGASALKLLGVVEDAARFKHIDLASASKLVTSTLSGNVRAAKALGIQLIPVTTNVEALRAKYKALGEVIPAAELLTAKYADKQATADLAVRKLTDAIGGQGEAFAKTGQGKAAVFNAQMDQLSDNLGKGLLPALNAVLDALNRFGAWLAEHPAVAKAAAIAVGVLSAALLVLSAAALVADAALSPILIPLAAATVAIGVLSFVAYKLVTDFRNSWPLLLPIVLGPLGAIIAACIHWHSQIAAVFTAAWNAVKGITSAAWGAILGVVHGATSAIEGAVRSMVGTVTGLFSSLEGAWERLRNAAGKAIHFVVDTAVLRTVHAIIQGILDVWNALRSAASHVINFVIHVSAPHIPKVGGGIPFVPGIASGGLVTRPTLAMVGEAGPEVVIPLNKMGNFGGGGGDTVIHNVVTLDGKVLYENWKKQAARDVNRNGGTGVRS